MSIIVGFTKMAYFANLAKDSLKVLQKVEMKQQKKHIDSWLFSRKGQIGENGELGKNPSKFGKTSIEVTKRGILANLGEKGKFQQKWRVCQKFIKSLAKYSNEMTKRGILTNGDFTKITNLAKIYLRLGKFKTRWQKRHVDNCGFYETGECQNWWIWETFINCLAKTPKWVDKTKACKNLGTINIEIEPRVVPDLMVLKWQRNNCHSTWHCYQEKTI